jgi:uncharacterized integral membrane protein
MAFSFEALGRVLRHVGGLALLRADLAAEEVAIARRQWVIWLCAALAAVSLWVVAVVGAGAWLTLLLWDRFGAGTPGVLALVAAAAGGLLLRWLLHSARTAPAALAQTRAALREDYEALAAAARPARRDEDKR